MILNCFPLLAVDLLTSVMQNEKCVIMACLSNILSINISKEMSPYLAVNWIKLRKFAERQ